MSKKKTEGEDISWPVTVRFKPGSEGWKISQEREARKSRTPKKPEEFLYTMKDINGSEDIVDGSLVDIADYIYNNGIMHAAIINVGRSIPRIEDGLKFVERRAIYVMKANGYVGKKRTKVDTIIGDMLGMVHPHGDQAVEGTIYRIGNDYRMMIPYVSPKGDYGNMMTMKWAAPRYAEGSLSEYADDCFFGDVGPLGPLYDTIDSYNYKYKEPIHLISRYPNILMQWNLGIGKGLMTWLGAFNSKDIMEAAITLMDDPGADIHIYPDTPGPVEIVNKKELRNCFDMRDFHVKMRAPYHVETYDRPNSRGTLEKVYAIVFTALPIGVIGQRIIDEIRKRKKEDPKKYAEILDVSMETSEEPGGIKIYFEYQYGYDPNVIAEKLYKATSLSLTVGVKYNLIFDNHPEFRSPREILLIWINQRYDQKRRYYHQLSVKAAKDYALYSALSKIVETRDATDEAIALIRSSNDDDESVTKLRKRFGFTDFQARSILEYKIKTLQKMNIKDTIAKRDKAREDYKTYHDLLGSNDAIKEAVRSELKEGIKKYGKKRIAKLRNLSVSVDANDSASKLVFYNSSSYFCCDASEFGDMSDYKTDEAVRKFRDKIDSSFRVLRISNSDTVYMFSSRGEIRIVNGYSFSVNDFGIAIETLGIRNAAAMIPESGGYDAVVVVTAGGYGKVMNMAEISKSGKGKIVALGENDRLADVVPFKYEDGAIVGMAFGDTMYYARVSDLPNLKRGSAGLRLIKNVKDLAVSRAFVLKSSDIENDSLLIYGDSGYAKVIGMKWLVFSKRGNNSIQLAKRDILGAIVVRGNEDEIRMSLPVNGPVFFKANISVDKTVKIDADKIYAARFKPSTTISAPVRLWKISRGEWYSITED